MKETGFELSTAADVVAGKSGKEVEVRGWVSRKHTVGGLVFAIIRDGTGYVQVSVKKGNLAEKDFDSARSSSKESAVVVRGEVRDDKRAPGGKEVAV